MLSAVQSVRASSQLKESKSLSVIGGRDDGVDSNESLLESLYSEDDEGDD